MANKIAKWTASVARVALCRMKNRGRLRITSGKPLYLASGARIDIASSGKCDIGEGVYLSKGCLIQVNDGATLTIGDGVFFNENTRVIACEDIRIGSGTLFGPNVCVYDHDHVFDGSGVHEELASSSVSIGERCWIAANVIVTKGVSVCDKALVGGGGLSLLAQSMRQVFMLESRYDLFEVSVAGTGT